MKLKMIIFAVLFGILSLAPNMQGGQFFKISELVEHYEEHLQTDKMFSSFLSLVSEHYFNNHKTSDSEEHMPFKSTVASVPVMSFHTVEISLVEILMFLSLDEAELFGESHSKINGYSGSIWHPPKSC
jgi:hypothetical protein